MRTNGQLLEIKQPKTMVDTLKTGIKIQKYRCKDRSWRSHFFSSQKAIALLTISKP